MQKWKVTALDVDEYTMIRKSNTNRNQNRIYLFNGIPISNA